MRKDASSVSYYAKWRSGEIDVGIDPDELDKIPDAEDLKHLHISAGYEAGENLDLRLSGAGAEIKWQGSQAADKARRIAYDWSRLPGRAPLSFPQAFLTLILYLVGYLLVSAYSNFDPSLSVIVAGTIGLALFTMAIFKTGPFTVLRAVGRPVTKDRNKSTWRESTFLIPLTISVLALVFGGISGVTDLISFVSK